ncbi:MAG TPA: sulfocyanin-like copper-binding protein [Chloroflexia bacterium]
MVITLAFAMLVSLAACGTTTPATQPVATATQAAVAAPVGTSVGGALETSVAAPVALPTDVADMGDMGDMNEGAATPTQSVGDAGAAATATPATDQGASAGSTTQVQGTLREWAIDLSRQEVPAGKVVFTVTNTGQNTHNFTVMDSSGVIGGTPNFSSRDGAQTLELELAPGTYTIICSLPGHAVRGQQTQLVVK